MSARHFTLDELNAGLPDIARSPKDHGVLRLIVRRPRVGAREVLDEARLDVAAGLVGDTWHTRSSARARDRSPNPDMQLNIMNARAVALIAGSDDRWPLAGDQLFLDLDLSAENLPAGTRLAIGSAVIEVTAEPHTGCGKFAARFGVDATKFVNSKEGRRLHLRGINARVVQSGTIRAGDVASKRLGDFPHHPVAGRSPASGLELQDRPARVDGPSRRFVPAGDALQVHPVLFEVQVVLMSSKGANKPFQRSHNNVLHSETHTSSIAVLSQVVTTGDQKMNNLGQRAEGLRLREADATDAPLLLRLDEGRVSGIRRCARSADRRAR